MEAALLSGFLNTILTKLLCLAEEKYKVYNGVKDDLVFLEKELRMISGFIDEKLSSERDDLSHVEKTWIEELRKLSHGIEDCIDNLMYLAIRKRQAPLWLQIGRYLSTQQSFQKLADELKRLKEMPAEEHARGGRYRAAPSSTKPAGCLSSSWSDLHSLEAVEKDPVGIDNARDELLAQLEVKAQDQQMRLKVVAIVGLPGSGKTLLARAVYDSQSSKEGFDLRVWVRAAERDPREVLMEILRQLNAPLPALAADHLDVHLRGRLMHKRYLIVIDDMQTDQWNTIASSFPDDEQFGSRILVTTTVLTVAKACCSTNGYVFKMRKLDEEQSKTLFLKKACPDPYYLDYADLHSRQILEKCDGQALALVTVGQYLSKTGWPTEHSFDNPCQQLRCELLEDKTLERIRQVLVRTYASLPGHAPRACLMYFGMFPCDRPVRRKNLMRLWLAEGFLGVQPLYAAMELAAKHFDKLIDHNIIEPIDVSNNSKVKTCKTYGMMHEFILIKSISQDIIALFGDEKLKFKPCHVRRLCLHSSNASSETNLDVDLSLVRSLTVFGEARTTILAFHKYKLLRVLNLEECTTDLGNENLKDICKLRLLKYLSLGVTVTHIPRQIEKLRLLETLDLRRTEVSILPIEVLLLPCLIHLFGKFQLPKKVRRIGDVPNFLLSGKSQLETLAGFVSDKRQVFAQIMRHMKKLSKVKIWCDGTTSTDEFAHLSGAIQTFIHDKKDRSNDARSLSVHINELSGGLLDSLEEPCYLSSLKLQGQLVKLPRFVQLLRGLTELCIQSTELNTHLLGELGGLKSLRYLKLIADQLEEFTISDQCFPMLLRFCLVLECSTLPIIKQGALKYLTSLKVMCKGLIGLCGIKIEYLNCLKEITLHAEVNPRAKEEWEEAARNHPNRPNILLLKKDDNIVNEFSDVSVATNVSLENFAVFDEPAEENDTQMLLNH